MNEDSPVVDLGRELFKMDNSIRRARETARKPLMNPSATYAIEELCDAVESLAGVVRAACGHIEEMSEAVSYLTGEGAPLEHGPLAETFAAFVRHVTRISPLIDREPNRSDIPPLIVLREDQTQQEGGSSGTVHTKGRLHVEIFAENAADLGAVLSREIDAGAYAGQGQSSDEICGDILYAKVLESEQSGDAFGMVLDVLVRSSKQQ